MCARNGHDGIRRVGVGSARLTHSRALQAARRFGALMEVIKAHGLILGGVLVVDLERSELRQLRRPLASNWRPQAVGIVDLSMSEGEEDRAVEEVGCPRVEVVVGAPEEEAERVLVGAPILLVEILVGEKNGDVQEDGHHLLADVRDLVDHAVE